MRFCARRGVPEKVRSDNGTNFVGVEKELCKAMQSWKDDSKAKAHFLQKEIKVKSAYGPMWPTRPELIPVSIA